MTEQHYRCRVCGDEWAGADECPKDDRHPSRKAIAKARARERRQREERAPLKPVRSSLPAEAVARYAAACAAKGYTAKTAGNLGPDLAAVLARLRGTLPPDQAELLPAWVTETEEAIR